MPLRSPSGQIFKRLFSTSKASNSITRMSIKSVGDLPRISRLYEQGNLKASTIARPDTISIPAAEPIKRSARINDRISLYRGDITKLAVDAIVNAANRSLLGGGGVDGAIHRAAGPKLLEECRGLGSCETGEAKISGGHSLPSKKVIHAVGPIYSFSNSKRSEKNLTGCYTSSLNLAVQNGCKSIAFCAISTGIYGYPNHEAAPVALSAVRKFMDSKDGENLDLVVFVVFTGDDVDAYNACLPQYFPPVPRRPSEAEQSQSPVSKEEGTRLASKEKPPSAQESEGKDSFSDSDFEIIEEPEEDEAEEEAEKKAESETEENLAASKPEADTTAEMADDAETELDENDPEKLAIEKKASLIPAESEIDELAQQLPDVPTTDPNSESPTKKQKTEHD